MGSRQTARDSPSRASCQGLLRDEHCLARCCAAQPSPSPHRLRQLISRHRRQGGPSPPPDPPSATFASSSFAPSPSRALRQDDRNIACGVCASQGVR
eukprot:5534864-Prymnesium_polylepis.1